MLESYQLLFEIVSDYRPTMSFSYDEDAMLKC